MSLREAVPNLKVIGGLRLAHEIEVSKHYGKAEEAKGHACEVRNKGSREAHQDSPAGKLTC